MEIKFSKYHGCGNDFIIIDENEELDYQILAPKICNRYIGIGADGLIVVKKKKLEMLFYNNDGSISTMCGNGIRCFAKYCLDNNIVNEKNFDVITKAGLINIEEVSPDKYLVNIGKPSFKTSDLKMNTNLSSYLKQNLFNTEVSSVLIGTVHTVVFVERLEEVIKTDLGEKICNAEVFTDKTNVNFVEVIDKDNFKVRTYERGVGWTHACGTGACASFIIGSLENKCNNEVNIHFKYGSLKISKRDEDIYMCGPAVKIASGLYTI